MSEPVSALLLASNDESVIRKSLSSLLVVENVRELIVVLHKSTDATATIASEFEAKHSHISINVYKNGLITDSLNNSLKHCSCNYVILSKAGDTSIPQRALLQAQYLQLRPEVVAVGSSVEILDEAQPRTSLNIMPAIHLHLMLLLLSDSGADIYSFCFEKNILLAAGGFKGTNVLFPIETLLNLASHGKLGNISDTAMIGRKKPSFADQHGREAVDNNAKRLEFISQFLGRIHTDELANILHLNSYSGPTLSLWKSFSHQLEAQYSIARIGNCCSASLASQLEKHLSKNSKRIFHRRQLENRARCASGRLEAGKAYFKVFLDNRSWTSMERTLAALFFGGSEKNFGKYLLEKDELQYENKSPARIEDPCQRYSMRYVPPIDRWFWRPFFEGLSIELKRKLTGISLAQTRSFPDVFPGKSVAIVAGGPSATSQNWGEFIDDKDIVCRINSFLTDGVGGLVGKRCDLWATTFWSSGPRSLSSRLEASKGVFITRPFSQYHYRQPVWSVRGMLKNRPFFYFPQKSFERYTGRLNGHEPTSGLSLVLFLLSQGFTDLTIIGMDFYSDPGKTYYYSSQKAEFYLHSILQEVDLMASELIKYRAQVSCPEPLYSLLKQRGVKNLISLSGA